MKVSVSLPSEDVEYLDAYAREQGIGSRSAVLHRAVRLLRASTLADDYGAAWDEWTGSGDAAVWEAVAEDGLAEPSGDSGRAARATR
jgi:Arc/MetJ-type ribon-helix-helix transcriptional regulator